MSKKLKLLYIAEGGMFGSVFDSQVCSFLKYLHPYLDRIDLIALEPYQNRNINPSLRKTKLSEIEKVFDSVEILQIPPILGLPSLTIAAIKVSQLISRQTPDIIHSRGYIGSYLGLASKTVSSRGIPLIADLRGVVRQEFIYRAKGTMGRFLARVRTAGFGYMEKQVCKKSNYVCCVSEHFKKYLVENTEIDNNKITVIPTLTDTSIFYFNNEKRDRLRKELGIDTRIVFVYSGSLEPWQMARETVGLFREIKKELPEAFLLFLTGDVEKAKYFFGEINSDDYLLLSTKYGEVSSYLNAADIGLLLRERNIVNEVASPVKVGEYLCAGLPLIVSSGIGDLEEHIKRYNLGYIIDEIDHVKNCIPSLLNRDRAEISQIGMNLYGIENYAEKVLNIYRLTRGI